MAKPNMVIGDKQLAIQNYKKAVELNPKSSISAEKLKKLEAAP